MNNITSGTPRLAPFQQAPSLPSGSSSTSHKALQSYTLHYTRCWQGTATLPLHWPPRCLYTLPRMPLASCRPTTQPATLQLPHFKERSCRYHRWCSLQPPQRTWQTR